MKTKTEMEKEWFNDDDFWERYAPIMFDDRRWSEIGEVADGITRLARLDQYCPEGQYDPKGQSCPKGQENAAPKVADLCCGFGRISLELARRGFSVTGVDITRPYLETAKEDAAAEKLDIEFVESDVRLWTRPAYFDIAVNLYISFGYFKNITDDLLFARNVCESLKPGGCFIVETLGKEIAVRDFVEAEWFERAGYYVLTKYEALDSWGSLKNRWILAGKDGAKKAEKVFVQRLYAATELRRLLYEAGFGIVEIYGDWDETPYGTDARSLIVAGRKPK